LSDFHAAGKLERGKELLVQSRMPKETTLLIGDTDHDLEVGKALGIEVLLLADGHQSFSRLNAKHDRILKSRHLS
jgi:phosphoglycolate phosphatase